MNKFGAFSSIFMVDKCITSWIDEANLKKKRSCLYIPRYIKQTKISIIMYCLKSTHITIDRLQDRETFVTVEYEFVIEVPRERGIGVCAAF